MTQTDEPPPGGVAEGAAQRPPPRAWLDGPCPGCGAGWRCSASDRTRPACTACSQPASELQQETQLLPDGSLLGCLSCGHDQLYWARDFPRGLGIAVVVIAAVLAPFTMYLSLAVGALVDAGLVLVVRKRLHCYRCFAVHHGFPGAKAWRPYQLEVADWHRFGDRSAVKQTLGAGHPPPDGRRRDADRPSGGSST